MLKCLVMEIICWMQTPPLVCVLPWGLVMLSSCTQTYTQIHTYPTPLHHPQPLMSPLLFPTVSHLLHRAFFCFTYTVFFFFLFFFCLQLFCHSNRHSLTLQASHVHLVAIALYVISLPGIASSGTDLVLVKNLLWLLYRFTSLANQLFYCNRGAALMWRGLFW